MQAILNVSISCGVSPGAAVAADNWGRLYPSISVTTDYRYNGVSFSDRQPALQGSLYWWRPDKFYAGVWASGVDFNDPGNTSIEVDIYAGRHFDLNGAQLSLEILYTSFPDKSFPGPTYDFLQTKIRVRHSFDTLTLGVLGAWSPAASYGSGAAWRVNIEGAYVIAGWLTTSANAGRRWIEAGADRSYWDAGVTATWKKFSLDVRYTDTNLNFAECGFVERCDSTVVGTLTYAF